MTALYIALGFFGGRAIRCLLDKHPTTKPGQSRRTKTPELRVFPSRLPLRAPHVRSGRGAS